MEQQGERYLQAWKTLGTVLSSGGSWSGHEKNCCFLNTRSEQFADVSSLVGLDHPGDSRAIALVDWDQDGDLDLWCANRTAPRVRYLQNRSTDGGATNGFVAIRLQGKNVNRDAIGARLELSTESNGKTTKHVQTLRAGEGYLAQSTKTIHFGIGTADVVELTVRWPGGTEAKFDSVKRNQRYLIVEGEQPKLETASRNVQLASVEAPKQEESSTWRVVSSRRLPMADLTFVNAEEKPFSLEYASGEFTLLTLWASWCEPCIEELRDLQKHHDALQDANVRWLPVNADEETEVKKRWAIVNTLMDGINCQQRGVLSTAAALDSLDVMQKALVVKKDPLPLPCSFLIDGSGHLMVVYKGAIDVEQVTRDIRDLEELTSDPRDNTVPFPGLWATNSFPPDLMAVPTGLMNIGRSPEALAYMMKHVPTTDFKPPLTPFEIGNAYMLVGRDLVAMKLSKEAEVAIRQALKVNPQLGQAYLALAELNLQQRRIADAVSEYRSLLEIAPQQPMALNNLAWILATSKDSAIRNPKDAVMFAERLCEQTKHSEPVSLDTLSVALAANGDFDRAVEVGKKAIVLAQRVGKPTSKMEARLKLFQAGTAYSE